MTESLSCLNVALRAQFRCEEGRVQLKRLLASERDLRALCTQAEQRADETKLESQELEDQLDAHRSSSQQLQCKLTEMSDQLGEKQAEVQTLREQATCMAAKIGIDRMMRRKNTSGDEEEVLMS